MTPATPWETEPCPCGDGALFVLIGNTPICLCRLAGDHPAVVARHRTCPWCESGQWIPCPIGGYPDAHVSSATDAMTPARVAASDNAREIPK